MSSRRYVYRHFLKPAIDRVVGAVALTLCAPLLIAIALIVRIKLGSPILFTQMRPGRHGRPFRLYKFRTMVDARDEKGQLLGDAKRLSPFGKWLRSTSLDELPELWNVLRGDMSLIGPRPLLMEYLDRYTPAQARRHDVMPGITGWAQVNGRNAISWEEKFKFDAWYVENLSLTLDIKIAWLTVSSVLRMAAINKDGFATTDLFTGAPKKRPRIGFAGDRDIAISVLDFLLAEGDRPELLLVASPERASHADALMERCQYLPDERVVHGKNFRDPTVLEMIHRLDLDYIVSIHFPYGYPPKMIRAASGGILNLHPGFLPFGRGWHTPSWAILCGCPFGATLHVIDEGVDTGDILYQLETTVCPSDTAHTLYRRVKETELEVFRQAWSLLKEGRLAEQPQHHANAIAHKKLDLLTSAVQRIDLDAPTTARSLLRRLRALTTDRITEAAYFEEAGRRYRVRVEVSIDDTATDTDFQHGDDRKNDQIAA